MIVCRGIRGAITVEANSQEAILGATAELLERMVACNGIDAHDVASVIFTTTPDLNAEYPAIAARALGWKDVALLCGHEMDVPHGLRMCIRILIHWNTTRTPQDICHVYLRDAAALRPDRATALAMMPATLNTELETATA